MKLIEYEYKGTTPDHLGYIEDVYGTGISFNIFKRRSKLGRADFYKSAYSLKDAMMYLNELTKGGVT